jgi:predicted nucleic acid-binding protein
MHSTGMEFDTFISTSALARVTVEIRRDQAVSDDDLARLTSEIDEMSQRWHDRLLGALTSALGSHEAERLSAMHSEKLGTRSLDILHVAAAVVLGKQEFLTFDQRQAALAKAAGLDVPTL